ncbi:MAG: hypothetical protein U0325_22890 [Polyangiales bacterium]
MNATRPMLGLALALATPSAVADPARARLAWVRGAGADACPGPDAVRAAVTARLGYDPTTAPDPARAVEVTVSRSAPGAAWTAEIYLRDAAGALVAERRLQSDAARCEELVDAVAFAVALGLDGDAAASVAAPALAAPPAPACPTCPACPPAPPPAPRPRRAPRGSVVAEVTASVLAGPLASPAAELSLRVSVRPPRWPRLYLDLAGTPEVSTAARGAQALSSLVTGALGVCPWSPRVGAFEFGLCAGVRAGVLRVAGQGFAVDRIEERPWVALDLGLRARWDLTRALHLALAVEGTAPVVRDTLVVDDTAEVHRPPVVGLRAGAGLGVHFE